MEEFKIVVIAFAITALSVGYGIGMWIGNMVIKDNLSRQEQYIERLEKYINNEDVVRNLRNGFKNVNLTNVLIVKSVG